MDGVEVRVLGPLELRVGGEPVPVAGSKQRSVLAMLALQANQVVSVATLIDAVWGEPAPDRAEHTLQQHVSAVRKLLDPNREAAAAILLTRSPGYVLHTESLDADEFERSAAVGVEATNAGRWREALAAFDAALGYWRGPALSDVRESPRLSSAAVRLDEHRLGVVEMQFEARLECGQARELVPELEQMVAEHPLRERLRALLMLALYRSDRQADALAAYQTARQVLIDQLGIEPGAALRELEQAILEQSPDLDSGPGPAINEVYATFRADARSTAGHIQLPDGQTVLLVEGLTLIGRDPTAQVRLVDNRVSRQHAQIEIASGRAVVRDLASTNGTTVNGASVSEQELSDGDVISIGGVELRFHSADT
jgi:DNA-binding SARP family transcriptional activator